MDKLKFGVVSFIILVSLFTGVNIFAAEGKSIAVEIKRSDGTILKNVLMQEGDKIRLEETLPNSDEIGNVIISDGKECWHIPVIGKIQKYPPIKDALELIGIKKEMIKKEDKGKIDNRIRKVAKTKGTIQYKKFMETEDFGWLPGLIETYDSTQTLQSTTIITDVKEDRQLSDDLFNYRKVNFSTKAKEMAKKMYFE